MSWSTDGTRVAAVLFNKGQVVIIEKNSGKVSLPVISNIPSDATLAWSPDDKSIAIVGSTSLRIFDTLDWTLKGTIPSPDQGCRFQRKQSVSFTADSGALWVSCVAYNVYDNHAFARKYSVPSLSRLDEVEAETPIRGARTVRNLDYQGRTSTSNICLGIVRSYLPLGEAQPQKQISFLSAYDLTTKREFFQPINLDNTLWSGPPKFAAPQQVVTNPKLSVIALRGWTFENQILAIDANTGLALQSFASGSDPRFTGLSDIAVTAASGYVIGAVYKLPNPNGGLYVWDPRTGRIMQSLNDIPIASIALSAQGSSLAAKVLNKIRFYAVRD
jgi:hypothetical protein